MLPCGGREGLSEGRGRCKPRGDMETTSKILSAYVADLSPYVSVPLSGRRAQHNLLDPLIDEPALRHRVERLERRPGVCGIPRRGIGADRQRDVVRQRLGIDRIQ